MTRAALLIAGAVSLSFTAAHAQRIGEVQAWQQFDVWVAAVETHTPGQRDAALVSMINLTTLQLESAFAPMVWSLRTAIAGDGREAPLDDVARPYGGADRRPADTVRLRAAADRIRKIGTASFLRRAALLHTDVTLVSPDSHLTISAGSSQMVRDGRRMGSEGRPWHWMLARSFLHMLPSTQLDPIARLWYEAAGNHLWHTGNFVELKPHLQRALQIFPGNAEIWFLKGLSHESQSGPHVQSAVRAQEFVSRSTPGPVLRGLSSIGDEAQERAQARDAFRRAVDSDPKHVEARIRLGRVLSLTGEPDHAIAELKRALSQEPAPQLRYYAQLFLGRALDLRGRGDEARAAYEAAAALYPKAPAPRLALSQLALRAGDRAEAAHLFPRLAGDIKTQDEPWWSYHVERVPARNAWLLRLWAAFSEER